MRNRLLTEAIRLYGYDKRIGALGLPQPLLAAIKPPAIITGFHVGVLPLLGFALEQLQAKVLVIRRHPGGVANASFERAWTQGDDQHRALLFKRCRDFLHSGGFVYMAADPEPAGRGSLQAPFRQGSIQLARGPFALSRITGAPIIPLVSRWRRASVEFILGDPVQGCGEAELAAAVTAWLDRYLTADPMEISWQTLSLMI